MATADDVAEERAPKRNRCSAGGSGDGPLPYDDFPQAITEAVRRLAVAWR